jgi:hypothetical protein
LFKQRQSTNVEDQRTGRVPVEADMEGPATKALNARRARQGAARAQNLPASNPFKPMIDGMSRQTQVQSYAARKGIGFLRGKGRTRWGP